MPDHWIEKYRWGWCVLSGLLLVVSFAPFSCATAGWIALVPAWWVITRSETARRQSIRHGYLIGLIYFGGLFWWIGNVTVVGTVLLVLYLALYPAAWFVLVVRLLRPRPGAALLQALAAAALWVTLEWWRSWFLTGFNWNELGVAQAPSVVFRQLAAFGGVPLLSFFQVTVNVLWAEGVLEMARILREKRVVRLSFPFAAALLLIAFGFALGWHHLQRHREEKPGPGLSFACIQPDIPQLVDQGAGFQDREDVALDATVKLSLRAIADKPDLLVWPEAMLDEEIFRDRPLNEAVRDLCGEFGGWFLLGSPDFDAANHKLYNCAYLFSPRGEKYEYYQKTRLVLLGEFLPFGDTFPWLRRAVGIGMDFTPGSGPKKFVMENPDVSFSPLICFEDTLPGVTARAVRLRPDFFVTITNDGWYQGWCAAWGVRQHLANAVFRCVEHDRPMLRCANNGISCVVNQDGTAADRFRDGSGNSIDVAGVFAGRLVFYPPQVTLCETWGDWIVLISSLVTGMLGLRLLLRSFVHRRES